MAHTIFILGTDPQQCKELREILQERVSDDIVTAHTENNLSNIKESDTVIIIDSALFVIGSDGRIAGSRRFEIH